jgi:hypothetical protein
MAYCPSCGQPVAEEGRFCSNCGKPVRAEELAVPSLNDVPWWLGWLGIATGLTVIGLVLYCYWAYRRGRKDGVGREATDEPYANFAWRLAGWGAVALVLPIVDWYVFVHLPTLCYKHGLRVGAKEGTAFQGFTTLPALGAAFGAAVVVALAVLFVVGVALAIAEDEGGEPVRVVPRREVPTASGPLLTGAEAAGKAEAFLRDELADEGITGVSVFCDPEDYNSRTDTWIILCSAIRADGGLVSFRLTVHDRTGLVGLVD